MTKRPPRNDPPPAHAAAHFKSDRAAALARAHRRDMTFAEEVLWKELRHARISGSHWRRQAPIGRFIADFACHAAKLLVEVDGGIHNVESNALNDIERDAWLAARGYRILRFTNARVTSDPGGVVREILTHVTAHTPTPNPSPQGGGE